MFKQLLSKNISISFTILKNQPTNLGKMYILPEVHKRLDSVSGDPIISNCGIPTEKAWEFLDYHLKPLMQSAKSYVKYTSDF